MPTPLEQTLRDLPKIGILVKDREYRQVWRFEHGGASYYLKFYPKTGPRDAFRRVFRGSPAMAEFTRLQSLQRADIPAPRAVAVMMGFRVDDRVGDAVILQAIEPSEPLDQYLLRHDLAGTPVGDHRELAEGVLSIVKQLVVAKLGHEDLHLGNFLLKNGQLFLLDGYAVRPRGMQADDLFLLGHSVRRFATTTDLLRGWRRLVGDGPLPASNPVEAPLWDKFVGRVTQPGRYVGRFDGGDGWAGVYYKQAKYPHRWSTASGLCVDAQDWTREWPKLKAAIDADSLPILKRSRSGDVLSTTIELAGRPIDVIVKRPRRRHWYRYVNEIGRGGRARRAWKKTWAMVVRDVPAAWPLLLMETRTAGYVTDAVFVCEKVPGPTLAHADLGAMTPVARENLFRRTGRILRLVERFGFSHFDAKASNWIARPDAVLGPTPVMIDVDSVRRRRWNLLGLHRLLRSMHENQSYQPVDSLHLCRGYTPTAHITEEDPVGAV